MRNFVTTALVGLLVSLGGCSNYAHESYDKGMVAYRQGDYETALREWRPLAEQGYANVEHNLGVIFSRGEGVQQDQAEAVKWWRKAAEQGLAKSQFNLALRYQNGRGVAQNMVEAAIWYRRAAMQGESNAQHNLGLMYLNGLGVQQDDAMAAFWFAEAAEQGDVNSQFNLGSMYAYGRGVPGRNRVQAHLWWSIAATQGYPKALEARNWVSRFMTPAEVAQAQKLAREWWAKFEARKKDKQ